MVVNAMVEMLGKGSTLLPLIDTLIFIRSSTHTTMATELTPSKQVSDVVATPTLAAR